MSQRAELRTTRTGHTSSLQENRHCTYHWDSLRTLALFYTIHRYNHPENTTQGVAIRIKKGKEKSKGKVPLNKPLSIENIIMSTFHIIKFQRPPYILCAFPTHRTCPSMLCQRTSAYDESFLIRGTSLWNSFQNSFVTPLRSAFQNSPLSSLLSTPAKAFLSVTFIRNIFFINIIFINYIPIMY